MTTKAKEDTKAPAAKATAKAAPAAAKSTPAAEPAKATPAKAARKAKPGECVVDDGTPHTGRAVPGSLVCSRHTMHYHADGTRRQ